MNHKSDKIIAALIREEYGLVKEAGVLDTILSKIKDSVRSMYQPDHPIESILAFIGPGILWKLGFPWLSAIYTVMEAMGFDWIGFWDKVRNELKSLLESSKDKNINKDHIESIVQSASDSSMGGQVDKQKLQDVAKKYYIPPSNSGDEQTVGTLGLHDEAFTVNDALKLRKFAIDIQNVGMQKIIKNAYIIKRSSIMAKASGMFIQLITWVISAILVAVGFNVGGAILSNFIGPSKTKDKEDGSTTIPVSTRDRGISVSENADPTITAVHPNDMNSMWVEHFNINELEDKLVSWTISAYPQLTGHEEDIRNNSVFQQIIELFEDRNKLAKNLNLISFPQPYETKLQIINTFAYPIIRELGIGNNSV